ncbi:hypothetical protein [Paenibacillus sp. CF384]|uniref:hypothetical protein n=1 Tax=Paenibacillus sp. CF384 TaxID=1884382 RepID=UPI000896940F|nr:hypothetical protein [Paenibacillus sp. CF384]SDW09511.1 hypothetical protein SAMN05518855_1001246 [Paenibacillus sp. CF384]
MARFLIKHAIGGRTFVDTQDNPHIQFEVKDQDTGRKQITVYIPMEMEMEIHELLKWRQELNVFIFDELENGLQQKTWYYSGDGDLHYNETDRVLSISSSRDIRYLPSNFLE